MAQEIELGQPGDFHVHLRDGHMKELITPYVHRGGVSVCFVMPNLVPPITTVARAVQYGSTLKELDPQTKFLMSLYLSPSITPEVIRDAKAHGIAGVKVYPAGVTTNSDSGVTSYERYFPVFAEMEKLDLVLNLHGECAHGDGINVLNAEERFLPTLHMLHAKFPNLRIVLEHCTSKRAIEAVMQCGPTVVATITAHHLYLTVDSWGGNSLHFCKPVAKMPEDKAALIEAATSGNPKFFFGSDSAPHPIESKLREGGAAAGVFTQSHAIAYVAQVFEQAGHLDRLKGFVTDHGKQFYHIDDDTLAPGTVTLVRSPNVVPKRCESGDLSVVPFLAGQTLDWQVVWK